MASNEPCQKKVKISQDYEHNRCEENCYIANELWKWLLDNGFDISQKVKMSKTDSCSTYGLLAVDDIKAFEILFKVPRTLLLWEHNCRISVELKRENLPSSGSGWVKLILCLMIEYTCDASKWLPYMKFLPSISSMDQPMFWSISERENLLKGTGLSEDVERDLRLIEKEFYDIALPFIKTHSELGFDEDIHTFELYKHMVALVMAYSFTEPTEDKDKHSSPYMVPLADLLNHTTRNNAQLNFNTEYLEMVAKDDIRKGEEIFNTYGQLSNSQLLQMYGFVEPHSVNIYDTVDISLTLIFSAYKELCNSSDLLEELKQWLHLTKDLDEKSLITFGVDGALTVDDFKLVMKVLGMSREDFLSYKESVHYWNSDSSASEEEDDKAFEVVSFKKIKQTLSRNNKLCLGESARLRLKELREADDCGVPDDTLTDDVRMWRISRSRTLLEGQCEILRLLDAATAL